MNGDIFMVPDLVSRGRLQVSVYAANVGKPVGGALVRISPLGDRQKVLEELITDSSGNTVAIDLPAPPVEYSLIPSSPMPYSEYDVSVFADGFQPAVIEAIQILPDTLSYQSVNVFPEPTQAPAETIFIYPHTLYKMYPPKIPEDPVKELPPELGFVVLPKVVVPEFVVVHAGVPDDTTAPNYWVPFSEYIKNVASCEIYSTWPEQTIRANILAILSFALNRVYTEWYRNKGYNFTVTNSTAFDQAFFYGRNIFQNISNIVDQIFTAFITKPNIRQPLFTQYCDGTNTTCPGWLSQWGSKTLGDQGYIAIDILKSFYGQDIFLMTAEKVQGVPVSYPGAVLQTGSTGAPVRTIQSQLNTISNNYPAIPKLRVDGIYGPQTRNAVEIFQRTFGLPVTGAVDFSTWYKISDIYVAVARLAEA